MNPKFISCSVPFTLYLLWSAAAFGQAVAAAPASYAGPQFSVQGDSPAVSPQGGPVSYASVTQLNGLLAQLETAAKTTQADLAKLRIERWKTDSSTKKQMVGDVESVQRNLQNALPEIDRSEEHTSELQS